MTSVGNAECQRDLRKWRSPESPDPTPNPSSRLTLFLPLRKEREDLGEGREAAKDLWEDLKAQPRPAGNSPRNYGAFCSFRSFCWSITAYSFLKPFSGPVRVMRKPMRKGSVYRSLNRAGNPVPSVIKALR